MLLKRMINPYTGSLYVGLLVETSDSVTLSFEQFEQFKQFEQFERFDLKTIFFRDRIFFCSVLANVQPGHHSITFLFVSVAPR